MRGCCLLSRLCLPGSPFRPNCMQNTQHTTTTTKVGEGTSTSIERIISLNFALSLNYFSCCSTELRHSRIPPRECPSTHTLSHTDAHTHSHSQTIAIICNSRCSRAFEKSSKSTLPSTPSRPIPIPSHVERLTIYSIPFKSIFSSQFAKRLSTPSDRPRSQTETR